MRWLALALLLVMGYVHAADDEPDVIVLNDECRLVKKPSKKTKQTNKNFIVQFRKALPPPAPASAPPVVKHTAKPKPRTSLFPPPADPRKIDPEYDLFCDEVAPPWRAMFTPPVEDVPLAEYTPVDVPIEPAGFYLPNSMYNVPEVPTTFEEGAGGTPFIPVTGYPPVIIQGPIYVPVVLPATPEPSVWFVMLFDGALAAFYIRRRREAIRKAVR